MEIAGIFVLIGSLLIGVVILIAVFSFLESASNAISTGYFKARQKHGSYRIITTTINITPKKK